MHAVMAENSSGAPRSSWIVECADGEAVKRAIGESPGDPLEGIWSTTADGAVVAVVPGVPPGMPRSFAESFLLVILRSPRIAVPAGTVMGWCSPSARRGFYDCHLFTRCRGTELSRPKRFTMRMSDNSHLSLIEVKEGLEVSVWRMLPYMFRRVVRERNTRQNDLDGMLRIWPEDRDNPVRPRYL